MLNQQKYKKKTNHKMQKQKTGPLETPLLYKGLNKK